MALGGNEIPGASVFFLSIKKRKRALLYPFLFLFACFFFFFFQKRSEMLREDFFLK